MRTRALAGAILASAALLCSCSGTGGQAVADDLTVVVTQVTTAPATTAPATPAPATPAPATTTPTPTQATPTTTSTPSSPAKSTKAATPSTGETSTDTSSEAGEAESSATSETDNTDPSTSRPTSTGKRPVASWLGDPPADPDTPGPDGGPPCPADPEYVNETPVGLADDVIAAWKDVVAAGKRADVVVCLNDGKRSRAQQQAQFDEYAEQYGEEVAEQLVLPPDRSAHVLGVAVDVQPAQAYQWLQSTKGALGFCRIYDNEPWHFEYDPAFRTAGCPARLPQPER